MQILGPHPRSIQSETLNIEPVCISTNLLGNAEVRTTGMDEVIQLMAETYHVAYDTKNIVVADQNKMTDTEHSFQNVCNS